MNKELNVDNEFNNIIVRKILLFILDIMDIRFGDCEGGNILIREDGSIIYDFEEFVNKWYGVKLNSLNEMEYLIKNGYIINDLEYFKRFGINDIYNNKEELYNGLRNDLDDLLKDIGYYLMDIDMYFKVNK